MSKSNHEEEYEVIMRWLYKSISFVFLAGIFMLNLTGRIPLFELCILLTVAVIMIFVAGKFSKREWLMGSIDTEDYNAIPLSY